MFKKRTEIEKSILHNPTVCYMQLLHLANYATWCDALNDADDNNDIMFGYYILSCWCTTECMTVWVQFQKAFGKRGPKGEVKVINVHLDEVLSGVDVTKNLPNDAEPMMSHSKKRNKDMPSSQQKCKHQLSFLAFKVRRHCVWVCLYLMS